MAIPVYLKIKESLSRDIANKEPNDPIPSERDLVEIYGASRMTVRKAVQALVEEGLLYRDSNKGTFVADPALAKKSPTRELVEGKDIDDYNIIYYNIRLPEDEVAEGLQIPLDERIVRIVRVNRKEGRAVSVEELYYPWAKMDKDKINDIEWMLDLQHHCSEGCSVRQRFIPVTIPVKYVNFLKIALNRPIIMTETTLLSKTGEPIVYIREYNNPDERVIEIIS